VIASAAIRAMRWRAAWTISLRCCALADDQAAISRMWRPQPMHTSAASSWHTLTQGDTGSES
jgi:hypothetical protein